MSFKSLPGVLFAESQEQTTTEQFDISLRPPSSLVDEVSVHLLDRADLHRTYDAYQLCNVEEYFDLQFSMQSVEIPVVVDERRSESVIYHSRESSMQVLEEEILIHREQSISASEDFTITEATVTECNFVTTDVHFEYVCSTSGGHALAEAVVLTVAQQCAQAVLSSQLTALQISLIKQPCVEQLTLITRAQWKVTDILQKTLSSQQVTLDVVLLSRTLRVEATSVESRIPKMQALDIRLLTPASEEFNVSFTFTRTASKEAAHALVLMKSATYPEKTECHFASNGVWLELIMVSKTQQSAFVEGEITIARRETLHLKSKSPSTNAVEEKITISAPIQLQEATITLMSKRPALVAATGRSFTDSFVTLKTMLWSRLDRNLFVTREVPMARTDITHLQSMASVQEELLITCDHCKAFQSEQKEITFHLTTHDSIERNFVDSVEDVELELLSGTQRSFFVDTGIQAARMDQLSARFSGSVAEYFLMSTAFNLQPESEELIVTLLTKVPTTVEKTNRSFSDAIATAVAAFWSKVRREFQIDAILLIPRTNAYNARFAASTFENLHVIISFEVQSQENSVTAIMLTHAPAVLEQSSCTFSDSLTQLTTEFWSRVNRNLEADTKIIIARKATMKEKLKESVLEEENIVTMMEVRPEREGLEVTLLTPVPTIVKKISRSLSHQITSTIIEIWSHVQSHFGTDIHILISRKETLEVYLKASKLENITIYGTFSVQEGSENIVVTLLGRAPTLLHKTDRQFSSTVVTLAAELWSQLRQDALTEVDIYIARKETLQTEINASTLEETNTVTTIHLLPEAEGLEVTLLAPAATVVQKITRTFSYRAVDFIAAIWSQIQNNYYTDLNILMSRKEMHHAFLKACSEENVHVLTSFEVQSETETIVVTLLTRAPTAIETIDRSFSIAVTDLIAELWSELHYEASAGFGIYVARKDVVQMALEASTTEVETLLTTIAVQPQSENLVVTVRARTPTILEKTDRTFSSALCTRVFEMSPTLISDFRAELEILLALNETTEAWLNSTEEENIYDISSFDLGSQLEYTEVVLPTRTVATAEKVDRSFAVATSNLITEIETEMEVFSASAVISFTLREEQQARLLASVIENIEITSEFEMVHQEENLWATISSTIVEAIEKTYSVKVIELDVELYLTVPSQGTVEADIIATSPSPWVCVSYTTDAARFSTLFVEEFVEKVIRVAYEDAIRKSEETISALIELHRIPSVQSSGTNVRAARVGSNLVEERAQQYEVIFRYDK